ncbi:hypothetical protein MNBD_IGNAVI01-204 [hydrothermal vent metagenome]|uniref:Uncharacterized protein n=1 Tax=hydrothermal vent metagenome TaxID=652676 RepID=A0A3B1BNH4_9ZZZZ
MFGNTQLDSLLELGREYSYQFEFQKADDLYQNVMEKFPNSPYAPHYLSQNYLWFYLGSKDSTYKILYEKYSDTAFTKAETLYDKDEDNPELNNLMGHIHLLKSVLYATVGNSMDAFWAIKSSVSYFEDAVELDQNYYDPYLGLGMIKYALSFVPGFLGWAISITGLSGDKELGLRYIKLAYDKGESSRTEAAYHLSKIYTEYNAEYDSAKIYLDYLVGKYPNNILFLYQYAILLIDTRELEKADSILTEIINLDNEKFSQTTSFSYFLKAENTFKQNDFKKAISIYDQFLRSTRSIDYTGLAHLKIGLSYVMLNDNLIAKKYFILARNGNLDIPEDQKAKNDSYLFYDKTFTENDRNMILAENYFSSGRYQKSLNTIEQINTSELDHNSFIKLKILEAESLLSLDKIKNAESAIKNFRDDMRLSSSSYRAEYFLVLAKIKYAENDYKSSQKYLDFSFDYIDESNNKLMRHLVNLKSKLRMKIR